MTIIYETEVLKGDNGDVHKFQIRVNRDEDLFEIFIDDGQIAYGDWTSNLLEMFENIVKVERLFAEVVK